MDSNGFKMHLRQRSEQIGERRRRWRQRGQHPARRLQWQPATQRLREPLPKVIVAVTQLKERLQHAEHLLQGYEVEVGASGL